MLEKDIPHFLMYLHNYLIEHKTLHSNTKYINNNLSHTGANSIWGPVLWSILEAMCICV